MSQPIVRVAPAAAPEVDGAAEIERSQKAVRRLEHRVARVLTFGTLAGVVFVALGVVGLAASGRNPLSSTYASIDPSRLLSDAVSLRADALTWIGLLVLIATPSARVAASLVGFAAIGDRRMVAVAAAILGVIALGVVLGRASG